MPLEQAGREALRPPARDPSCAHPMGDRGALQGGMFAPNYGGQGWSMVRVVPLHTARALTKRPPLARADAYNVLLQARPSMLTRYLRPDPPWQGGDTAPRSPRRARASDRPTIATTAVKNRRRLGIPG